MLTVIHKKKFSRSILSLLMCSLLVACADDKINLKNEDSVNGFYDSMPSRINEIDVREYVTEHSDIFGDAILVFDSMDDLEELLDVIYEANSVQLRDIYSSFGFTNPILESNIVYDSVFSEVETFLQIEIDDHISESDMNDLISEFVSTMRDDYPSYCIVGDYTDSCNNVVECVSPLGKIDEKALCNELGLFVVNGVVFKFSGSYLLTCPIEKYEYIHSYDNLSELQSLLDSTSISGITDNDLVIFNVDSANVIINQESCSPGRSEGASRISNVGHDDHCRDYPKNNGNYQVKVHATIYPYWAVFSTNYRCKLSISNYYKGTLTKAQISCYFSCSALGWFGDVRTELCFNRYRYGLINCFNLPIAITSFKQRDFLESNYSSDYVPTWRIYVDIIHLYISLKQNENSSHPVVLYKDEYD